MSLPFPPPELMRLVGQSSREAFDNPSGADEFPGLDCSSVLDIGCGCGRVARRMAMQARPPLEYLGVDLNLTMAGWCKANLARPGWDFKHVDVYNRGLNPSGPHRRAPLPAPSGHFSLAVAWSVFTHILEADVEFNLGEAARCLRPGGWLVSTWFLFDREVFPFLQEFQHSLYCNVDDPTNAVVYDKAFVKKLFEDAGLRIRRIDPPAVRGFQWTLRAERSVEGSSAAFPEDLAPKGVVRAPL